MDIPRKPRSPRTARIKAAKALKKVPTALLLKKKAECDAKALRIVEQMIEPEIDEDWLLQNLGQINKAHMDDIVEERSIVKLCGYPLCDNPLKKVVRKQYQISTLRNKVYDIGRVKNFCSYRCYTATEYIMEQMLTSPLWVREDEEIPKFQILPKTKSRSKSPPGVEVDLTGIKLPDDNDEPEEGAVKKAKTSMDESTEKTCQGFDDNRKKETMDDPNDKRTHESGGHNFSKKMLPKECKEKGFEKKDESLLIAQKEDKSDVIGNEEEQPSDVEMNEELSNIRERLYQVKIDTNVPSQEKLETGKSAEEQPSDVEMNEELSNIRERLYQVKIDTNVPSQEKLETGKSANANDKKSEVNLSPSVYAQQNEPSTSFSTNSEPSVSHAATKTRSENRKSERRKSGERKTKAISFETLTTRVENSLREWITEETVCLVHGEETEKRKILENVSRQEKYAVLCKKLNHLQLEEEREDSERVGELKPAPQFSALQEEAKSLELKVRAFFEGKTVIDPNAEKSAADLAKQEEKDQAAESMQLPLLDLHAPKALRRRIFLDKLNRVMPDLLRALAGSSSSSQYSYTSERCAAVKVLVSTFALSATNIIFKTAEWTLVALIIIKLLSFMDPGIKHLLSSKQASMYTSMILMSYKLDSNYLETLIISTTRGASKVEMDGVTL